MFRRLFVILLLICSSAAAQDLSVNPLAPLDLSSPRATYTSFLEASREVEKIYIAYTAQKSVEDAREIFDGLARSASVFDISEVPVAQRGETAVESSVYLFDILMRLPALDPASIPGDDSPDLPQRWTIPGTEIEMIQIAEGPRAGQYLFSPATVSRLPQFHDRIMHLPRSQNTLFKDWSYQLMAFTGPAIPATFTRALPPSMTEPFLGTLVWKAILTTGIWLAIAALTVGWILAAARIAGRLGLAPGSIGGLLFRMTVPGLLALLVFVAHDFAVYQSSLAGEFAQGEVILTTVALYTAFAWLALLGCHLFVELIVALPAIPDQSYDAHLLRLIARVGGLIAAAAVLVVGADRIGIPALGLIAGVGVGGVALALAAQSTVENLFGGVSIFVDRPFRHR